MTTHTDLEHWQDALENVLQGDTPGPLLVRIYQQTASTQQLAKSFAPRRALIVADQQTAGRGRLGRRWLSAPGSSVLMSLCWPGEGLAATHDRVSMLAGVALAKAVEALLPGVAVRLKWPNDVMVDGRKLAGILIERVGGAFIIGIGLNVTADAIADPELAGRSTCLAEHGFTGDRLRVIQQIVLELDKTLRLADHALMLDAWRTRAALGHTQTFEHNNQRITGTVLDLDADHGLTVRRDTGEIVTLPAATTSVVH